MGNERDYHIDTNDTENGLTVALYYLKFIFAFLTIPEFLLVIYAYSRYPEIRNRRIFFTLYMTGIDCIGRMIFLCYYAIRIWSIEKDPTLPARVNCDLFTYFLFFAQPLTLTALVQWQLHALIAEIAPNFYTKHFTKTVCAIMVLIFHSCDIGVAIVSQHDIMQLQDRTRYEFLKKAIQNCKFEFFSRWSNPYTYYLLVELVFFGILFLCAIFTERINVCRRRNFENDVANSPFSDWPKMRTLERVGSVLITCLSVCITIGYFAGEITYLIEGNSLAKQILSLSLSVFAIVAPLQIMWLNKDMRRVICKMTNCQGPTANEDYNNNTRNECQDLNSIHSNGTTKMDEQSKMCE